MSSARKERRSVDTTTAAGIGHVVAGKTKPCGELTSSRSTNTTRNAGTHGGKMMRSAKSAIADNYFAPLSSAASMARGKANGNGFSNHANGNQLISRTITGLKRWSIINRDLPGARSVFTWTKYLEIHY
jgi:hypothetical protein